MPKYTANFYTDAEYASAEIEADTPEAALAEARELDEAGDGSLSFDHYDDMHPVNHIEILDDERTELAHWHSDDLKLRFAAKALHAALQAILNFYGDGLDESDEVEMKVTREAHAAIARATQ